MITGISKCAVLQISYKMIVTPPQAGVQFESACIPACQTVSQFKKASKFCPSRRT